VSRATNPRRERTPTFAAAAAAGVELLDPPPFQA
jgi:hypothetical protein